MDLPIFTVNAYGLENLVPFITMQESKLAHHGAMIIRITPDCELALKKRKKCTVSTMIQHARPVHNTQPIYTVYKRDRFDFILKQRPPPVADEPTFWSTMATWNTRHFQTDVTTLPNKSMFYEKRQRKFFSTYHVPRQSLLQILCNQAVGQFQPTLTQAHGPGAIFPLAVAQYGLPSLVYHHGGGARHWYIIRGQDRERLMKLVEECGDAKCVQHDGLFVDPSVFDKHGIVYQRVVQNADEMLVLAAGTIAQSFTTDEQWSESVVFGLVSWIRDGHAAAHASLCRCDPDPLSSMKTINLSLFTEDAILDFGKKQTEDFNLFKTMGLWDPREDFSSNSNDRSTCSTTNELELPPMSDGSSYDGERESPDKSTKNEPLIRESSREESLNWIRSSIAAMKREMEDDDERSESESMEYHRQRWFTESNFRRAVNACDYPHPGYYFATNIPLPMRSSGDVLRTHPHWNPFMNTYSQ